MSKKPKVLTPEQMEQIRTKDFFDIDGCAVQMTKLPVSEKDAPKGDTPLGRGVLIFLLYRKDP